MIEYGNARVAALRARLLSSAELRRLEEAGGAAEMLGLLERAEDWQAVIRDVGGLGTNPAATVEAATERHHAARLAALPGFYADATTRLVEALVLPLDHARLLAILRRRRSGESPDLIGGTIVRGAVLSAAELGRMARAPTPPDVVILAGRLGILEAADAARVAAAMRAGVADSRAEDLLVGAADRARDARAAGRGADAAQVRHLLADERIARAAAVAELLSTGAAAASLVERTATAARLEALARAARRDPLGIGAVAGYVAAVELQAMRIRAALARVVVGWSDQLLARLAGAA